MITGCLTEKRSARFERLHGELANIRGEGDCGIAGICLVSPWEVGALPMQVSLAG